MQTTERTQTAQDFLEAADSEFEAGDDLQGSEKMWGAAAHAVMMVARKRGWPYDSHRHLAAAADRIVSETGDDAMRGGFVAARGFRANSGIGFMEDDDIERGLPEVRQFVEQVLKYAG
jgi:hypothetical protein